jgi:hypothetical protein
MIDVNEDLVVETPWSIWNRVSSRVDGEYVIEIKIWSGTILGQSSGNDCVIIDKGEYVTGDSCSRAQDPRGGRVTPRREGIAYT